MTIYLSDYSTFNSTQELNYHVSQHVQHNAHTLTTTQRKVFRFVARYSVKYPGASHLKNETIATGTGLSERTIRRSLGALEAIGAIERRATTRRKQGGTGANIIVVLPFVSVGLSGREETETSTESKAEAENCREETFIKRHNPNFTVDTGSTDLLRHAIPERIYETMAPFFEGDVDGLYEAIGTLFRAKASVDSTILAEDHTEYTDAFLNVIRRHRAGKVRSLNAYLYTSWQAVTSTLVRRKETSALSDWFAGELA